jgi:hypothetical protein
MTQEEQIRAIKNIFVPTNTLQEILGAMKRIRELSKICDYQTDPDCMFITGETGVGKTTYINQYMNKNPRYTLQDDDVERTIVPVLYCSMPKAKHPKPIIAAILTVLGDPLQGANGDARQLTERLVRLVQETRVELIIIDEFQHGIESKSKNVIQEIGEWFKIFINSARIPIVFVGVPWARPVLEINVQLKRRVRKRNYTIPNYTLDTFDVFQMFLQKVEEALPVKPEHPLWQVEFAFRLFAVSKGNISELMDGVIIPAGIEAIYDKSEVITLSHFIKAVEENTDFLPENNPISMDIEKVVAFQQKEESTWNPNAKKTEKRVVDATYAKVKFSDLNLKSILSKR